VHNEADLADALDARRTLAFDLDTYRLLIKHLNAPAWVRTTALELVHLPKAASFA
jgi:hypothetical protein